jgi:L-ascorbate metabolism protein UlaG (beta-lactamase superfamily)
MGPFQAAIAASWLGVKYAFPMHYDTFPPIKQDPSVFVDEVNALGGETEALILDADVPFNLTASLKSKQCFT